MKINKLKINSYGKLKNKEIEFKDNINIVYGKNESGKSTVLKFITNTFYGISKNKKGKEYSDFEKYTPWDGEEFSGKIEYELDNKEKYEVYREFKKKNPKIYNSKKEDISKQFNIDKSKGNEFFYEQTKLDEDLFLSTIVSNQDEVKLENKEQNILIQRIANIVGTGEDNVSYKRAIDRINRRQLDEIGTERSREKPLNILNKEIEFLENEKQELEKYKDIKYELEDSNNNLIKEISKLEKELKLKKEIKKINEAEKIEKEKIKIKENEKEKNIQKINLNKSEINKIENENKKILEKNNKKIDNIKIKNKKIKNNLIIIFILLIIINIIQYIFINNNLIKYIFLLTVPMFLIFLIIYLKNKNNSLKIEKNENKKMEEKINLEKMNYLSENNLLENNNKEIEKEINEMKNNINLKNNLEKEKIKNNYLNIFENEILNQIIDLKDINYEIEKTQNEINDKKIKLHKLEIDKKNIEPKLDSLSEIEEKLVNDNEKKVNLKKLEKSMILAKEILEKSYEKMKSTVTPRFTENLSSNISKITNGKYNYVKVKDENGLVVELENGNYIEAGRLSVGTIDQLYLSLRLSMVDELSEEKMPIILDEAFAYFDNERLENILKYLNEEFKNRQIIILTCTKRETEIYDNLNVKYNLINL